MTMAGIDISATQSTDFFSQKVRSRRHMVFESFAAENKYTETFGTTAFFAQSQHDGYSGRPASEYYSNGYDADHRLSKMCDSEATISCSDSSILTFTPEIQVFRTDVQRCNSHMCLACRPSHFDHATRFLRVPQVTPENIPKLPSKWWSKHSVDSSWMDRFWTSLTKIMDGEACGPVKDCGGESTKCKKSSSIPQ